MTARAGRPVGFWTALAIAAGVSLVLVLALRLNPGYDPYGWLVWGRQTLHLALDPVGAPSWKPLTWLLTTPLALAGGAAPTLWLIAAVSGGLMTLWLAFRLAARLQGPGAGVLAMAAILVCRDWFTYLLNGNIEPFGAALGLAALDRHIAGRHRVALGLICLAALIRPECFLVLGGYMVWLWRTDRGARPLVAGAAVALPLLWFLPPYLATGNGFNSSDPAFHVGAASHDPLTVLYRGASIVIWPVALAALAGMWAAWRDGGRRWQIAVGLAGGAAAWAAGTAAMAAAGFPGLQRFMVPPAAAGCVLAGAGAAWAIRKLPRLLGSRWAPAVAVAALAAVALTLYYGAFRVTDAVDAVRNEQYLSGLERSLHSAVLAAGGAHRILACGHPTADLAYESALAWDLGTPVGEIGFRSERDVRSHHPQVLLATGALQWLGAGGRVLAKTGPWRVVVLHARASCLSGASVSARAAVRSVTSFNLIATAPRTAKTPGRALFRPDAT
jgi:hypothetical protein